MRSVAEDLIKDEALIFRRRQIRVGYEFEERFVLIGRVPAHFYTVSRSGSVLDVIRVESGQEESESLLRVMLLESIGTTADRVVPVIRGKVGGMEGTELYELMETPIDASKQAITYEAPIKMMDLKFRIDEGTGGNTQLLIEGAS